MQPFTLTVHSFEAPTVPAQPADLLQHADHTITVIPPASPLRFTLALPSARDNNPLFPATHLQLSYVFSNTCEVFDPVSLSSEDLSSRGGLEQNLYSVIVPASRIPRAKVNGDGSLDADVILYAWKRGKLLGKWTLGRIEGLGFAGSREQQLAKRRVEQLVDRSRPLVAC